jgi:ATP-binding cassette subfamily C (CFTR/MRP) protein 1
MDFSACADDSSFGPAVQGCRDNFDFTIRFERLFFGIIPASVLIVLGLGRAFTLLRRPTVVTSGGLGLRIAKLV